MASTKKKTTPQKATTTTKKSTATKSTATKSTATKSTATKSTATKSTTTKATAKTTAKQAAADPKQAIDPKVVEPTATSSKTTTRKTNSGRNPTLSQEIIHTVVFTRTKQDQELLEAIEQELDAAVFANFDELCKEALYQFLWEDESQSIQPQLRQLEASIVTQTTKALEPLAQQVRQIHSTIEQLTAPLTQQLEQLQSQVETLQQQIFSDPQDFAFVPRLELEEVELESPIESIEIMHPSVMAIEPERDPFLDRLSALLEDF